jgi:hypothetical protein
VLVAKYNMVLPDEKVLAEELEKSRRQWEAQHPVLPPVERPGCRKTQTERTL